MMYCTRLFHLPVYIEFKTLLALVADKTVFSIRMNAQSRVKLEVLDIQEKLIRTIIDQEYDS